MSDAQTKFQAYSRRHPFLRVITGSESAHALTCEQPAKFGGISTGLARTAIPVGTPLCTEPGTALNECDALHKAFARAVNEDQIVFRLAADVGIVEIRRECEEFAFFNIDVDKLIAGAWERCAILEYLKRSLVTPLATLAMQLPRGVPSNEPRHLSLAPRLRPTVAQAAHMLGFDQGASVELVARGIPGGVEFVLRSGGTTVHLAWNVPHKLLLDLRFS